MARRFPVRKSLLNRIYRLIKGEELVDFTADTVLGSLSNYISSPNSNFVPMNANFCLVNDLLGRIKKKERKEAYAERSLNLINNKFKK